MMGRAERVNCASSPLSLIGLFNGFFEGLFEFVAT